MTVGLRDLFKYHVCDVFGYWSRRLEPEWREKSSWAIGIRYYAVVMKRIISSVYMCVISQTTVISVTSSWYF